MDREFSTPHSIPIKQQSRGKSDSDSDTDSESESQGLSKSAVGFTNMTPLGRKEEKVVQFVTLWLHTG